MSRWTAKRRPPRFAQLALAAVLLAGLLVAEPARAETHERKDCGSARWRDNSDGRVQAQVWASRMGCRRAKRVMVRYAKRGFRSPPGYNCTNFGQAMPDGLVYACAHRDGMNRGAYMGPIK